MDIPSRFERLVQLVTEVKHLRAFSQASCSLLRVLGALTDEEIEELGARHLNKNRHGRLLERLSGDLGMQPAIVWHALAEAMAWDLEDYRPLYASAKRSYDESGWSDEE